MSKRFIDTGIFDDDWFMDLTKDGKLLWIYFITKCDHAGILRLNEKLCKVQTDIKDLNKVIKDLGNRLVTVRKHLYFIPKYIEYQYPGFPNSKVRQQSSAVDILIKYGLFDKENLTLTKELPNSYEHDTVNDTVIVNGNGNDNEDKISFENFVSSYHNLCPIMNKVQVINDTRKGYINARIAEFGEERLIEVFRLAGESDFLNGKNNKAWKADFDWIIRPNNFIKIMEGKYSNKKLENIKPPLAI